MLPTWMVCTTDVNDTVSSGDSMEEDAAVVITPSENVNTRPFSSAM